MIGENIRQDESWLTIDPIVGCTMNCQYCFLQGYGETPKLGRILLSPQEMIERLLASNYYTPTKFIMLGSETDFFMNSRNTTYLETFLRLYSDLCIQNFIVVVTKNEIRKEFLDFLEKIGFKKLILYFSLSWLPKEIEPGVNRFKLIESMKRVNERKIPVIHYWRPFIPQNSSLNTISEVLSIVTKHAKASVISGLKLNPEIRDKMVNFWPELKEIDDADMSKISNIWPKGVRNVIKSIAQAYYPDYPIVETNSCALSIATNTPDFNLIHGTQHCVENICPAFQRSICLQNQNQIQSEDEIQKLLDNIGYKGEFSITNNSLVLHDPLEHGNFLHLRHTLNIQLVLNSGLYSNHEWVGIAAGNSDIEI
jgi:DNA repair photolyase